ncbi:MAG: hypothetical protein ACKOTZ_05160, partial [Chloroflexota bacterium]
MEPELAGAIAENLAAWHEIGLGALGVASGRTRGWWHARGPVPPIYLGAIALTADADAAALDAGLLPPGWAVVADPFGATDLRTHGWQPEPAQPWSVRAPAPAGMPMLPPGCTFARVADPGALAAFEATAAAGFGVQLPAPGGWHAPRILHDPRSAAWTVRVGDAPIATAMSVRAGGVLGIYGVATRPAWGRRGIAAARVRGGVAADPPRPPGRPPSPLAVRL